MVRAPQRVPKVRAASTRPFVLEGRPQDDFSAAYWLMRRLGNRWTLPILIALRQGPLRFAKLKHTIDPVSQRMLTLSLRRLEQDKLVDRVELSGQPPPVVYSLTPLGSALIDHLWEFEGRLAVHRGSLGPTPI